MIRSFTDNRGNGHLFNRFMTTRWPMNALMMELAAQLRFKGLFLETEWSPRTHNVEADRLSNLDFSGFDPALRIRVPLGAASWLVLPGLMAAGRGFEAARLQAAESGAKSSRAPAARRRKEDALRVKDPW